MLGGGLEMNMNRWTVAGTFALVAGVLVLGLAYASSGVATAGNIPCDATATPTVGAESGQIEAFQAPPECTATPTRSATATQPRQVRTHTPTATPTDVPVTVTPVPPTEPPATSTPSSGNEGANVKPPNTGSGDGANGSGSLWLVVLGAASLALGGGAVLAGMRRR